MFVYRDLNGDVSIEEDVGEDDESPDLNNHLWVEKYAPRKYTDLLSEEVIKMWLAIKVVTNYPFYQNDWLYSTDG